MTYLANHFIGQVYRWTEKELDVRRPQFAVLFCLAQLEDVSARDVCKLSGIPANSISRAISPLIASKLVTRTDHHSDKRRDVLRLSASGRKLFELIIPRFRQREDAMLGLLSERERRQLLTLLGKLVTRGDDWAVVV